MAIFFGRWEIFESSFIGPCAIFEGGYKLRGISSCILARKTTVGEKAEIGLFFTDPGKIAMDSGTSKAG